MEAANWNGANIHRTSLKLGLRSEASGRFEKGLQPEQAMEGQAVATRLMVELTGATLTPGTIDVGGPGPAPKTIRLRDARVAGLLGAPIARERCREILEALEFTVAEAPDGLEVTVPPFRRTDVAREADLIEEVARLDGLHKLPATLPSRHNASGRLTPRQRLRRAAADALTAQGLHEIVGWSFTGPELFARLRLPETATVGLQNPLSGDLSRLRTTLLGSLLDVAQRNRSRGAGMIRLFEAGAVYLPNGRLPHEPYHLGGLLTGPARPGSWRGPDPPAADFFAAKGVLQGMFEALRIGFAVEPAAQPFLHPGAAASIQVDGRAVGWLGEIHPSVAAQWDLPDTVAGFELDLDTVPIPPTPLYRDVTSFPEVREDIAVVVSEAVPAARLIEVARRAPLLQRAEVFDVYRGEQLDPGQVSIALRLTFRASDRTLTDEEVAAQRETIVAAIAQELGGRLR
jgi:phenylalanyl-tRNA synthetase beta chain